MHLSEVMTIAIASLPEAARSLLPRRGTPTPRAIAFHGNDKGQPNTGRTYVNYLKTFVFNSNGMIKGETLS
ncbi:MAG: hypothetical protein V7K95_29790 [Nostoc sp.]